MTTAHHRAGGTPGGQNSAPGVPLGHSEVRQPQPNFNIQVQEPGDQPSTKRAKIQFGLIQFNSKLSKIGSDWAGLGWAGLNRDGVDRAGTGRNWTELKRIQEARARSIKVAKKLVRRRVDQGESSPGMRPLSRDGRCSRQKEWGVAPVRAHGLRACIASGGNCT